VSRSLWACKAVGPDGAPCRTVLGAVKGQRLDLADGVVAWVADLRAGTIVVGCPRCGAGRRFRAGTVRRNPGLVKLAVTDDPVPLLADTG